MLLSFVLVPFAEATDLLFPIAPFKNHSRRRIGFAVLCGVLAAALWGSWNPAAAQAETSTTTTLAITAGGGAVTTVASGTVVTLTATVTSGATALTVGTVNFCDASATYCTDIHVLGSAQLTSAGTAVLKFRPGIGSHSYKAFFVGTNTYAGSSSSTSALAVTGKHPTSTILGQLAVPGGYTLTATVTGIINVAGTPAPTGSVSFVDTTDSSFILGSVAVSSGTAGFSFSNSLVSMTVPAGMGIATADFNGDGIPDLAVGAMNDNVAALSILLGNGDGTFTSVTPNPVVGDYPYSVVVGDFNGDGIPDLAAGNIINSNVSILLGKGDGAFTAEPNLDMGSAPQSLVVADFNGDGLPDLAVVSGSSVLVFIGKGDGTFEPNPVSLAAGLGPQGIAAGDLNGDGIVDLVVANDAENGSITIFPGNGDGTFKAGNEISGTGSGTVSVIMADLNGDGIPDLAVTNYDSNSVSILLGNGNGTFQPPVSYTVPDSYHLQSIQAVDFNGDGIADLAIGLGYEGAAILPGNGDGTFGSLVYAGGANFFSSGFIAVADFNGDGLPDIAGPDQTTSNVGIFLNQQSQTVTATLNNANPPGPGTQLIEASYSGDSSFAPSVSATTSLPALVATPVISPTSGAFTTAQLITVTETTPGATIYYEAYGAISTGGFVPYTGPIPMEGSGTLTIQAYATATGYQESQFATSTYTFSFPPAAAPVLSPAAGSYSGPQTLTISDATPGAAIYYTTNGSTPTTFSAQYTGPITVSSSETVVAAAIALGYSMSVPASAEYIIDSSASSFIYTVAGNGIAGYSGDGGPATVADLNYPTGVAVVPAGVPGAGNIYIADETNNVVRMVAAGSGTIATVAGTGIGGYNGDNLPATSAQLLYPSSVAVDTAGNLWILDRWNNKIRTVSATTGTITSANLNGLGPSGFALDSSNNLYVISGSQVWEVNGSTNTLLAGNGTPGYSGDNGPAISATLEFPKGIAVDGAGNVFIADTDNDVIRKVTKSTGIITTVAGDSSGESQTSGGYGGQGHAGYTGDGGPATNARLYLPNAITLDTSGNLYIADTYNSAIRKVTSSTGIITTFAGDGQACESYGGDGGPASGAALCIPESLSFDSAGDLYIADSTNRVRKVLVSGPPPTTATATPVLSVAGGTYAGAQTVTITDATPGAALYVQMNPGSATASTGTLAPTAVPGYYRGPINVTGTATMQVVAVAPGYLPSAAVTSAYLITTPPTSLISTVAGSGTYGFSGNGGPATSAEFGYAHGLALDKSGDIYFTDTNNNVVWMVAQATGTISVVAGNGTYGYSGDNGPAVNAELRQPAALAVDNAGNLYIADTGNGVVREVAARTGTITTIAGVYGLSGNGGDGGPATSAYLSNPNALAFDKAGNLYIAQSSYDAVRVISASTGIITTFAGGGSGTGTELETNANNGDGGLATKALLNNPVSLAFDTAGNLYIGDGSGGRVRMVAASTGIITTVAGDGDPGSDGDGGLATKAEVTAQGLAVDASGNLYISGYGATIREVTAGTGMIASVVGNGFFGYSGDGGSATAAGISSPQGIAFDSLGNLYIADEGNYRIRKVAFSSKTVVTGAAIATVTATPSATTITNDQSVTVQIDVVGTSVQGTPTGSVTLSSGSYTSQQMLSNGAATFTIAAGTLSSGANTLTAVYSGDPTFASATATTTVTVSQVVITASSPSPVSPGDAATATVTLSAGSNYSGTMNLTCALGTSPKGAVSLPTCSLKPASVTIATGGSGTTILTVNTTAASGSALVRPSRLNLWGLGGGAVLAGLLIFGIPSRRRWMSLLALLCVLVGAGLIGCGGGGTGGGGQSNGTTTPATTAGSYTFTVTGTDSTNATITASINVTVTVN